MYNFGFVKRGQIGKTGGHDHVTIGMYVNLKYIKLSIIAELLSQFNPNIIKTNSFLQQKIHFKICKSQEGILQNKIIL